MGFRIEDGKGRGRYAAVDSNKRLVVSAVTTPIITAESHGGNAYGLVGRHTLQASATTENVAFVQNNNSASHVHMQTLTYAVEAAAAALVLTVSFNVSRTSGGTVVTPIQLNRGSAKEAGIVAYDNSSNDLVLGVAAEQIFSEIMMASIATAHFPSDGTVILGPGDTLCVRAKGTSGDKITVGSFMFEFSEED